MMTRDMFLRWERESRDTIDFKRCYVDMTDDIEAALLLSQIVFYFLPDRRGKRQIDVVRYNYEWIVRQRTDWWEECRLKPKRFDRAMKILQERELVESRAMLFNNLKQLHITILWPRFLAELERVALSPTVLEDESADESGIPKTGKPDFPKRENPISQNGKTRFPKTGKPELPDTTIRYSQNQNSRIPKVVTPMFHQRELHSLILRDMYIREIPVWRVREEIISPLSPRQHFSTRI